MSTIIPGTKALRAGGPLGEVKPAVALYDFAIDGGAVGTINLRGDRIPAGAIITDALLDVQIALAGGTVTDTVALGSEAAGDVQAAIARNNAIWADLGPKRVTRTATAAPVVATVDRPIQLAIAATPLTAGRLRVVVWYVEFGT